MIVHTATRFTSFPPYPLAEVPQLKRELRARGVDVIDLGAGDADLAPPPPVVDAVAEALGDPDTQPLCVPTGATRLPGSGGRVDDEALRRERGRLSRGPATHRLQGGDRPSRSLASCPGDATIVPDPGYQPYAGGTLLAGGEPCRVPLRADNGFLLDLEEVPAEVVRRARILYLNYPNNPTAAAAPRSYLEEAVRFCTEHDILLAYDNAYSEIAFDGYRPPSILEIDGARDVAVEFHSFSKTYNMTGWRIGFAVGSAAAVQALEKVKSFVDTGVFLAVQAAARAALGTHEAWVPGNVEAFRLRRDALVAALADTPMAVPAPRATMYLWTPAPGGDDAAFARRALTEAGVVLMPGSALGAGGDGWLRFALTQPAERLAEAAARLAALT